MMNVLDLTYLSGDLDQPDQMSETVWSILDTLQKTSYSIHFLEGVSGCGKTKTIFDVGRYHYLFLFTFLESYASPDVQNCLTTCTDVLVRSKREEEFAKYATTCQIAIQLMLFQRILAFILLRYTYPQLTPWQWTLFQIRFACQGSENTFLKNVMNSVKFDPQNWPIGRIMLLLSNCIDKQNIPNRDFLVAIDEAQALLHIGVNMFPTLREPIQYIRSFYSFFMRQIVNLQRSMIIAGSTLSLQEVERWTSAYADSGGNKPEHIVHHRFRFVYSSTCYAILF
jgi:hypothetical protein